MYVQETSLRMHSIAAAARAAVDQADMNGWTAHEGIMQLCNGYH